MSRRSRNQGAAMHAAAQAESAQGAQDAPDIAPPQAEERSVGAIPPVGNDDRDAAFKELLEARKAAMKAPAPEFEPDPNVDRTAPATEATKATEVAQVAAAPATEATEATEVAPEPEMVTLKVDGEDIQVARTEVDANGGEPATRMKIAMEKRLKAANEALAEAKRMQAFYAQQAQPVAQAPAKRTLDEVIAEKVGSIQFGTAEEATAAIKEILAEAVPKVDFNQMTNAAVQQSLIKHSQLQAAAQFKAEFGDLLTNPLVARMIIQEENNRLQAGIPNDFNAFYRSLGNEFRSAFGRQSQPDGAAPATAASTPSSTASAKEARKASIVNLPTAGSARASAQEEPKPKTRDEILNEARRARGIPLG